MRRLRVMVLTLVVVLMPANAPAWGHGGKSEPPKRVLVLVLDQLRPDYVDKFDMRNVKASCVAEPLSTRPIWAIWRPRP